MSLMRAMEMGQHQDAFLTAAEHSELRRLIDSGTHSARTLTRARILLLLERSQGQQRTHQEVAEVLGTTAERVQRIKQIYVQEGLQAALHDKAHSGGPPKITGEIEARLVTLACSSPPAGRKRWTLRLLAEQIVELGHMDSISNVAVYQRLKKTLSSPGR